MKISIIIPVYNVKQFLNRCVKSILDQDFFDYEILLIDDGSTDGSDIICDELAKQNKKIKTIHKKNGGLSSARNTGIDLSSGDYVMFIDSDDWIERGSLSNLVEHMENDYDMIMGRAWVIDEEGIKRSKLPYRIRVGEYSSNDFINYGLANENDISFCSTFYLYKAAFIKKEGLRFYEGITQEDELWTPKALLKAKHIYVTDIYFYYHFIRTGSIMHSGSQVNAKSALLVCEELNGEYKNYPTKSIKNLKNRLSLLFLWAIPQISNPYEYIKKFGRLFPLKNAKSAKQKTKGIAYALSPEFYCKLVKTIRKYQ